MPLGRSEATATRDDKLVISASIQALPNVDGTGVAIFLLNCSSIRNKIPEIELQMLMLNHPDIVCLTEIWINSDEAQLYNISGYQMYILQMQ
jgi:hypothetical protein